MCGITGAVGPWAMSEREKTVCRDLMYLSTLRGKDSTGTIFFNHAAPDTAQAFKVLGLPNSLESTEDYQKRFNEPFSTMINHNRKATMGGVTLRGAHPYRKGSIIGVHNGTLSKPDIDRLAPMSGLENPKKVTDTELLYDVLSRTSPQTIWSNITGAATLVWLDTEDNSVNFASNGKRPFFYWLSPAKRLFFASEPWMLVVAICRIFETYEVSPVKLEKNKHYKVTRSGRNSSGMTNHIVQHDLKESEIQWEAFYRGNEYSHYTPHRHRYQYPSEKNRNDQKTPAILLPDGATSPLVPEGNQESKHTQLPKSIQREDGTTITSDEFLELRCSFCQDPLIYDNCTLHAADLQLCDECWTVKEHIE